MAYTSVCKHSLLGEGEMVPFTLDGREVLLVWPDGGELKAFQGECPHEQGLLKFGGFNGRLLTCTLHNWVFDGRNGQGLSPTGCALEEYPLRIENGWVEIELPVDAPEASDSEAENT